jgi:hypothetical protein
MDVADAFRRALATEDEAYLRWEERLVEAAPDAEPPVDLVESSPMGPLLAELMQEAARNGGEEFEQATAYLDDLAARAARTAMLVPRADIVIEKLTARFGNRLTAFLGLRLVKDSALPDWRVMATLGYLDRHKTPAATEALIRFAARTSVPRQQAFAVTVLRGSGDPALAQKLAAERSRLGRDLPAALTSLA